MNYEDTEIMEFLEKMPVETEQLSEQIGKFPEKIGTDTEQIDEFLEKMPEKRRYRGQRGQDKAPRKLNYNSIMNLKPFKSNAVTIERESKYMVLSNNDKWIVGIVLLLIGIIVIWKTIDWLKNSEIT